MTVVVQKYGGSSVASTERIMNVARRIVATHDAGNRVCAVISARGDTTDELLAMAHEITPRPPERELGMPLSTGERISCALLAMAIHTLGREAVSFTGSQAGIVTDTSHTKAKIVGISPLRVEQALADGKITLVAGFQGSDQQGHHDARPRRLRHDGRRPGRRPRRRVCEIYTDVDGVYTADPPSSRRPASSPPSPTRRCSRWRPRAPRSCPALGRVRAPLQRPDPQPLELHRHGGHLGERGRCLHGTGHRQRRDLHDDEAKVTVRGVPDRPGVAADVFSALADAHVNVDMIIQNVGEQGHSDISCTVPIDDLPAAREALDAVVARLQAKGYVADDTMAKLSLIGAGMRSHPGVAALMFRSSPTGA